MVLVLDGANLVPSVPAASGPVQANRWRGSWADPGANFSHRGEGFTESPTHLARTDPDVVLGPVGRLAISLALLSESSPKAMLPASGGGSANGSSRRVAAPQLATSSNGVPVVSTPVLLTSPWRFDSP